MQGSTTLTNPVSVRVAHHSDIPAIAAVINGIGLFTPEEAEAFSSSLLGHFEGAPEGRFWLVTQNGMGAAYLSPEPSPCVWNLLFLGVLPGARRGGLARALIGEVERRLRENGARMLLIDTSTEPPMEAARALYVALGYERVGPDPRLLGAR
jgi:ribosomal protein S18 acetylase RimI-like enzyme